MTAKEMLQTLLDSQNYKFIKEKLTEEEIWKFALLIKFVFDEETPKDKWINANDFSEWLKEQKTGFDYNRCEVLVDRNGIWESAIETYLKERSEEE